jgi:hypothetical protein
MRFLCVSENLEIAFDVPCVIMWMSVQIARKRTQVLTTRHRALNRPACFGGAKIRARRALAKGIASTARFIHAHQAKKCIPFAA